MVFNHIEFERRVVTQIEDEAKFCPVCGKLLKLEHRPFTDGPRSGMAHTGYDVKTCPEGHGDMFADTEYGFRMAFELNWDITKVQQLKVPKS